ncbi:HEAT repeat protein [Rosistilla ulvae]|uniref:HEAT repeat protein n=1 Tax=Rosistilla ulvae TaxID=1930277 RepID=A0A517LXG7_9BACT|nr:HEAT repeat domain-containing protein [Rosistilla ulvae]QDS87315.1 HEAT repeat protein [Rosistilla ulvae]
MHRLTPLAILATCALLAGCHDGPLFALKTINPVYRSQWAEDEKLGPTDAQRLEELQRLVASMPSLSDADQEYWLKHIEAILENDKNPEMRTHAIRALAGCRNSRVIDLCETQMTDESIKVRMAVCDVLGTRDESRSTQLLATTIGSESNEDVQMAAIAAVGKHRSPEAAQALKASLRSRNPAVRVACVESLGQCTGKDLGDDPQVWVAYLDGKEVDEQKKSFTRQMQDLF